MGLPLGFLLVLGLLVAGYVWWLFILAEPYLEDLVRRLEKGA